LQQLEILRAGNGKGAELRKVGRIPLDIKKPKTPLLKTPDKASERDF
jgi:hypothetical protein